jgi:hypothetical protein
MTFSFTFAAGNDWLRVTVLTLGPEATAVFVPQWESTAFKELERRRWERWRTSTKMEEAIVQFEG